MNGMCLVTDLQPHLLWCSIFRCSLCSRGRRRLCLFGRGNGWLDCGWLCGGRRLHRVIIAVLVLLILQQCRQASLLDARDTVGRLKSHCRTYSE